MLNENQPNVQKFIDLLGCRCSDRVTGIEGVITHVGFDLYGCIQVILHPGQTGPGKISDTIWLDVNRLEISDKPKAMEPPSFQGVDPQSLGVLRLGKKPAGNGPGEKPVHGKA